ncbi:hypothetical protein WOLCODRAFT_110294 [Wolfiporia cocos MD-104 SS10]|uniref:Heterokaryon incompatibility domain-containing protein n=1 Tax=Wolfiporia cocos (strain MD-104) TaxID=742152 RepID=A0A2H3JJF0_WOLCO|nr:hypothetical protein WOLCODRAFT_110294 [Wolfiporia cocos MD-104 SS10]
MVTVTTIYEIPLLKLRGQVIDITEAPAHATPGRFRLVDCEKFSQNAMWTRSLCVDEFSEFPPFPDIKYAAVSYVWKGNPVPKNSDYSWGRINVKGAAGDSDPIGIAILVYICHAAWILGYKYLWLDRLCIIQHDKYDKAIQIRNMYSVYSNCGCCLVLPGGIQRLVPLQEETNWITRAWTLQEAIAPPEIYVLFECSDWKVGRRKWSRKNVQQVIESADICAIAPLADILANSIPLPGAEGARPSIIRSTQGDEASAESARVQLLALWGAMMLKGAAREQAIWRSSLMRTSSRPVDMVYSIMGLFGVTLDTHRYGVDDRLDAAMALAQETLKTGRFANWLGISSFLPPSRHFSTFPETPQPVLVGNIERVGYILPDNSTREVAALMNRPFEAAWWLTDIPNPAEMDDAGYLTLSSLSSPVSFVDRKNAFRPGTDNLSVSSDVIIATDGSSWRIQHEPQGDRATYLVYVGRLRPWDDTMHVEDTTARAIVVEEHAKGRFHLKAWCWLGNAAYMDYIKRDWSVRAFSVGGPD